MKNNSIFPIDFNHTKSISKKYKATFIKKIAKILEKGIYLNGDESRLLEKKLVNYLGGGYAITVASGNDAIYLALKSLNLKNEDEIIIPVNAYPTAFPVIQAGCKLIPVDVDNNGQLDPTELKKKITSKTKVIILVHLYGLTGEVDKILDIARKNNIYLIEDAAQAFGTTYQGKKTGSLADIGCFSFYPTKNLPTLGNGGAIWTKHRKIYDYLIKARNYGEKIKYKSEFPIHHSRLPEIQAAVINSLFDEIDKMVSKRKKIYDYYVESFSNNGLLKKIRILKSSVDSTPAYHLFVIEAQNRNDLQNYLKKRGIETHIHYPYPIHLVPAFSRLFYKKGDFPVAEKLAKSILSLPFHQFLTKDQIDYIVLCINKFYD